MKILHLYYDLMNLYGEYGNVVCLKKHLEDQGIEVNIERKTIGDRFNFVDYDFIYCGSGLESNQIVALNDLMSRKESLLEAINNKCFILFTGNAMELLGKTLGEKQGLDIVSMDTRFLDYRNIGDVIMHNETFGEVVGFVNKATTSSYSKDVNLFSYVFKYEGLKEECSNDGYRINNLIGTHIIGPILVKNPKLMKYIVENLIKVNNPDFVYKDINYIYEEDSYNVTLNALKQRK